ncbi:MAG: cyclic nucleotide-binding/CBS domain-containing protein [bacterium]|nr:cyclic nucleotide-binding/CBS domain-containing protein [bacterium]
MIARIADFLSDQHPFDLLADEELAFVRSTARTQVLPGGTAVLTLGGPTSGCLHLIARGEVRLLRDGREVQLLEEGDCFGYPSIINRTAPAFDAVTVGETTLHCVPADVFRKLLGNAAFAEFFLASLGERLRRVTGGEATSLGGELTTEIGSLDLRPAVTVPPDATVAEAARMMRRAGEDVALVTAEPTGILTDNDFQTKVLAENRGPDTPVADIMTRPLKTLPAETPVHGALMYMLEERIRHLPVTGPGGHVAGILAARDLLRHQSRNPLYLMRRLDALESPEALAGYGADAAGMIARLFAGGLKVGQIGRIFASLNGALVRRLCRLAEQELGPPPCPYAWLVFGSEGRMEQALLTDQDNALVYAADSPEAEAYFARFAERVVGDLVTAGFPPCPGGCMATLWNKSLDAWTDTVAGWIREPTPDNLMVSSIFFDFRAVAGDLDASPLADLVADAAESQLFMAHLARVSLRFKPPLGLFRRIKSDGGRVDLKKRGIASIAAAARVYALESGTRGRPTRERLEAAMAAGVVSRDLGHNLVETYRFLLQLRLDAQLTALREGREPDNDIRLAALSSLEHRHLKDAFGAIAGMQQALAQRYGTTNLG